ncbi:MAG: hypothetical protein ACJ76D_11925 [Solirubrobacterales bacterium]
MQQKNARPAVTPSHRGDAGESTDLHIGIEARGSDLEPQPPVGESWRRALS